MLWRLSTWLCLCTVSPLLTFSSMDLPFYLSSLSDYLSPPLSDSQALLAVLLLKHRCSHLRCWQQWPRQDGHLQVWAGGHVGGKRTDSQLQPKDTAPSQMWGYFFTSWNHHASGVQSSTLVLSEISQLSDRFPLQRMSAEDQIESFPLLPPWGHIIRLSNSGTWQDIMKNNS